MKFHSSTGILLKTQVIPGQLRLTQEIYLHQGQPEYTRINDTFSMKKKDLLEVEIYPLVEYQWYSKELLKYPEVDNDGEKQMYSELQLVQTSLLNSVPKQSTSGIVRSTLLKHIYVLKEKSRNMFNTIKSSETPDLSVLKHLTDMLLTEQRHQRADLSTIKRQLHTIINSLNLQKQVDEYFEDNPPEEDKEPD